MESRTRGVGAFRARYRVENIGPTYSGWGHLAFTSITSLAIVAVLVSLARGATVLEWLVVPVSFLFANLVEYLGHRGPMHHPRRRLRALFNRHVRQHHRFFTRAAMAADSPRDWHVVLFPPALIVFFFGLVATPVTLLLVALVSRNAGFLFGATAAGYFLLYEWLHLLYHQPEASLAGRMRFLARLRHHHLVHHDPRLMNGWNFNITFPIADAWFDTTYRGPEPPPETGEGGDRAGEE